MAGATTSMAGTGGGAGGTNGGRIPSLRLLALVTALTLVFAVVNALTVGDDLREAGQTLDAYEPWVWELTSAAFWIAAALPLIAASRRLRPPALGWPASIAAHLTLSLPVCALHVAWLAASRAVVYAGLGAQHDYDWSVAHLIYEWRKDLLSVAAFAVIAFIGDRWSIAPATAAPPPYRVEVRDGARVRWFAAADIERVEAAGNYVELHTADGAVLHRATLSGVETDLAAHGFVRIHRSRLVRRDAVTGVATTPAGDFEATLASGATVAGSRRFRAGLTLLA